MFDVTEEKSKSEAVIARYYQSVQLNARPNCKRILVGTKCDCGGHRKVTPAEGLEMAQRHGMQYFEASAKTGEGVAEAFEALIREVARDGSSAPAEKRGCAVA